MTLLVTLGRKLSLGEVHQKDAVQRGFCSATKRNHENLDGVGRSQDLPDAHCYPAVWLSNVRTLTAVPLCSSVCKNMQMCFTEILIVPLNE